MICPQSTVRETAANVPSGNWTKRVVSMRLPYNKVSHLQ